MTAVGESEAEFAHHLSLANTEPFFSSWFAWVAYFSSEIWHHW